MSVLLYNIFLLLVRAGIRVASIFNPKAAKWIRGRKQIMERLAAAIGPGQQIVWMHCASLGEFEQGRPVLEAIKQKFPHYKLLLTFFSPSGYEAQKKYNGADWIFYLPLDGPRTAKQFLDIVNPRLVIFVKYEFWFFYLKKIKYRQVPLILISALFRKDMSFFKWYGGLQKKMLARFDRLFVQNASSKKLLDEIGLDRITTVSGDTRFDRVMEIVENSEPLRFIDSFTGNSKTIVAGSTWPGDEEVLQKIKTKLSADGLKLIIAPHEISGKHLSRIKEQFPGSILYSELTEGKKDEAGVLIIDNIGMLSRLYRYSWISYVGGGFQKMGVHNVLEPAVYGRPVLMGPYYRKYYEAIELVECGGAFAVEDDTQLYSRIKTFLDNSNDYENSSRAAQQYVMQNAGATGKIISYIQENRLLTS